MYAVICTGGKQYKVKDGQVLRVESLAAEVGETVKFEVMMISKDGAVTVGTPVIENAYAEAQVVKHAKGAKIDIFKYKAKKNERKRQGHRQPYTEVKIVSIVG